MGCSEPEITYTFYQQKVLKSQQNSITHQIYNQKKKFCKQECLLNGRTKIIKNFSVKVLFKKRNLNLFSPVCRQQCSLLLKMFSGISKIKQLSSFQYVLSTCFIVCFVGCILQIVLLNQDFFQLKIISVRETENLKEEDIPGFTICIEKVNLLLDREKICANLTIEQCIKKTLVNVPISVQHLRTLSTIQFVKECWAPTGLSDKVSLPFFVNYFGIFEHSGLWLFWTFSVILGHFWTF